MDIAAAYARYRRPLVTFGIQRGMRSDEAEDAVQDVFVELLEQRHASIRTLHSFLFGRLQNMGRQLQRDQATRQRLLEEAFCDGLFTTRLRAVPSEEEMQWMVRQGLGWTGIRQLYGAGGSTVTGWYRDYGVQNRKRK